MRTDTCIVGASQVGRAAKHCGTCLQDGFNGFLAGDTRCDFLWLRCEGFLPLLHGLLNFGVPVTAQCFVKINGVCAVIAGLPCRPRRTPTAAHFTPIGDDLCGDLKGRVVPVKRRPGAADFLTTERCAMNSRSAGLGGRTKADNGFAADQTWFFGFCLGCCNST